MIAGTIRSKRTAIGLDLGESALRGAQLRRSHDGFAINALAKVDRTMSAAGAPEPVEPALHRLFSHSAFQGRAVVTALNPPEVEFHVVDVPQAVLQGGENADKVIHWEIGRLTSLSADQVETRHWLLPPQPGVSAHAIGVSARREAVVGLLGMCHRGRLRCSCVDTGATALHRFGRLLRGREENEIWGLLDIGARQCRLILCLGNAPILIRYTGDGGMSWTERIAEVLQISRSAAEIQKSSHGIALFGRRESRETGEPAAHDEVAVLLLGALRSELNEMAAEIKRSYEYVLSSYPGRRAGELILVGGGAEMPNLPEFLGGILGITVRRSSSYLGEPGCRIQFAAGSRNSLDEYATAVGLAIAEA